MATSSPDPEISFDNVDLIQDNDHTANSQENDNLIDMSSIQHERDHRSNSEALSSNVRSRTGPSMPASEIMNAHSTPQHTDDIRHVHLKSDRNVYDQCTNNANESSVRNNTTLKPTMAQIPNWSSSDISCSQSNDTSLCYIIQAMEANSKPDWSSVSDKSAVVKTLWRMWDRLEIQNGILYRIWYDDSNKSHRQIVVPDSHKAEVFLYSHDIPSAAHLGVNKTLERLRQTFYWSGMKDDVQDYCNKCDLCSSRKPSKPTNEYVSALHNELETIHKMAQTTLRVKAQYRKRHYDLTAKRRAFIKGDAVWLFDKQKRVGVCSKLSPQWKGPCLVTGKIDDLVYFVKTSQRSMARPFHIDRLRLYRGSHKPAWLKI
ncbi:NYNRI-like protein [Mya arenaria]|uniref:NYNRI-like protein n=1 Tax=Mya arenaria TaxID=6604 RepID=A0ABY7ED57_MYAAR|nr:NYNRI-like protein [Mya arenaria]